MVCGRGGGGGGARPAPLPACRIVVVVVVVVVVGTMGFEPTTSSTRSWQYTKLTYVPGARTAARFLSLCGGRRA